MVKNRFKSIKAIKHEYPFESNYLKIEKYYYHFLDEGKGDETLLMVHGNPTWSFYYRNLIKHFSKEYRCIAVDHIGCGFSQKPKNYKYTLKNHIKNLELLVETLDLKKINLVVHDWGGAIGLGFAVRHPELINKIIILNTAAFRSIKIPFRINILKIPILGKIAIQYLNLFAYPATFMTTVKPLPSHIKQGYLLPYNTIKNRIAIYNFVNDIPMSKKFKSYRTLYNIEKNLYKLKNKKKLILWGMKDFCFNEYFLNKFKEIYNDAKVIKYYDAGHYILEDKKYETIKEIEQFLKN